MKDKIKNIGVWFSINKNGFLNLSIDEPKRNSKLNKWEFKFPYLNSVAYKEIKDLVEKAKINWEHEPEYLMIQN